VSARQERERWERGDRFGGRKALKRHQKDVEEIKKI